MFKHTCKFFTLSLICILSLNKIAFSQIDTNVNAIVFTYVDNMPRFNGNIDTYIQEHIKKKYNAQENDALKKIVLKVIIDETGSVLYPKIISSNASQELNNEAITIVESMPKWKPGRQNKKVVKVYTTITIKL
ncbi:MAG: energy transducer TonB [Flavipsychrobacter sp.]